MNVKTLVQENKKFIAISLSVLTLTLIIALSILVVSSSKKSDQNKNNILSLYSSSEVFTEFQRKLANWSADYRIQSCNAEPISSLKVEGEIKQFVGFNEGRFASWNCNVFSPGKKQILTILWSKGSAELSQAITMNDNFISLIADKPYFNELENIIDSKELHNLIVENGYNGDNEFYTISLGGNTIHLFEDKYVWEVKIFSRQGFKNNSANKLVKTLYFDAIEAGLI